MVEVKKGQDVKMVMAIGVNKEGKLFFNANLKDKDELLKIVAEIIKAIVAYKPSTIVVSKTIPK